MPDTGERVEYPSCSVKQARGPEDSTLIPSSRLLAAAFVLLALPGLARAAGEPEEIEKSVEQAWGGPERFGISIGAYAVRFQTGASLDPAEIERRAKVDLEDVLGLTRDQTDLRVDGYYRFNPRHALEFGWVSMDRDSFKAIEEEFEYGDYIFGVGAEVTSRFRTDQVHLAYEYSFVNRGRVSAGFTAGLSAYYIGLDLSGSGNIETPEGPVQGEIVEAEDLRAPVPLLGLHFDYAIRRRLFLRTSVEYLDVSPGDWGASLRETKLAVDYFVSRHVGFGIGYDAVRMRYEEEDDPRFEVRYDYSGVLVYATFGF